MAGKPVRLVAATQASDLRQAVWSAIRKLQKFKLVDVVREVTRALGAEPHSDTVRSHVQGLTRAGFLTSTGQTRELRKRCRGAPFRTATYELVKDVGVEAPRVSKSGVPIATGSRPNMWRAARILGDFSLRELIAAASREDCSAGLHDAQRYIGALARAGYFVISRPSRARLPARFRVVPAMYTGPKAPRVLGSGQIIDPNLGRVVWPKAVA